ncbi:MAG: hypothetical protein KC468_34350, partial [Myxococcales bacterium]|nr:hypothetical protein [Myxococcales bacterium]
LVVDAVVCVVPVASAVIEPPGPVEVSLVSPVVVLVVSVTVSSVAEATVDEEEVATLVICAPSGHPSTHTTSGANSAWRRRNGMRLIG